MGFVDVGSVVMMCVRALIRVWMPSPVSQDVEMKPLDLDICLGSVFVGVEGCWSDWLPMMRMGIGC
jgi:hypothetical protein